MKKVVKKAKPAVARKRVPVKKLVTKSNILYKEKTAMADEKAKGTTTTAGTAAASTAEETADARLVGLVVGLVPAAPGEVQPTEEQKALALELQKLVEAGQKKAAEKAKSEDKGAIDEASARFFSGDVGSALAKKIAEEQAKKDAEQQKAAQAAAGQPAPPAHAAKQP